MYISRVMRMKEGIGEAGKDGKQCKEMFATSQ